MIKPDIPDLPAAVCHTQGGKLLFPVPRLPVVGDELVIESESPRKSFVFKVMDIEGELATVADPGLSLADIGYLELEGAHFESIESPLPETNPSAKRSTRGR